MQLLLTDPLWHRHPSLSLWGCCSASQGHGWHRAQSLAVAKGCLEGTGQVLAGAEGKTFKQLTAAAPPVHRPSLWGAAGISRCGFQARPTHLSNLEPHAHDTSMTANIVKLIDDADDGSHKLGDPICCTGPYRFALGARSGSP